MTEFKGNYGAFRYHGIWLYAKANRVNWTAAVQDEEAKLWNTFSGTMLYGNKSVDKCTAAIQQALERKIQDASGEP